MIYTYKANNIPYKPFKSKHHTSPVLRLQRIPPALGELWKTTSHPVDIDLSLLDVQLLIESNDVPPSAKHSENGESDRNEDKTTAEAVKRSLIGKEEIGSVPV